MNPDISRLEEAVLKLSPERAQLSASYFYAHLPLAMADAVFSIGVRYSQCQNAVHHFAKRMDWEIYRKTETDYLDRNQQHTVREMLKAFTETNDPAADLFDNRGYANPRASKRILKATLLREIATLFCRRGIDVFQDFNGYSDPKALDQELTSLPAMSRGVILRYLRMLAGDENQVKPDRMILRFIGAALSREVKPDEAVQLIRETADLLKRSGYYNMNPRVLDNFIWRHQSSISRARKKPATRLVQELTARPEKQAAIHEPRFKAAILLNGGIAFAEFWGACRAGDGRQPRVRR